MQSIDVNTSRVEGALSDKLIIDSTIDEIKSKLLLIFSIIGLRSHFYPKGQEKEDLHNYIIVKYGLKTLSELVLAFDLAISGELDLKPEDVKVYDQFTIAYMAMIMSAYKKWLYNQSKLIKPKPIAMIEQKYVMTDAEMAEWVNEWRGKVDTESLDLIPLCFYEYLNIALEKKIKFEYLKKAADHRKTALYNLSINGTTDDIKNYNAFLEMYTKQEFTGVEVERIKNTAKRMIIKDYLTNKKANSS